MMTPDQEVEILFQKYLSNRLTPVETGRLKELVSGMDESSLDARLQQLWNGYSPSGSRNHKAYNQISVHLEEVIQPAKQRRLGLAWRVAAAVLLPVFFFASVYWYLENRTLKAALAQEYVVNTGKGERASLILPDGTRVYLNAQTALTYPASFSLDDRVVELTGEAYFEVEHHAGKPFKVLTSGIHVKVLGTRFNLYAYPGDRWFEATLIEGKIEASPAGLPGKAVLLNPRQKASYNPETGEMKVVDTDMRIETAWRRGDLIFRSERLEDVFRRLESFYGIPIVVEGPYPDELFTGSFHEDDVRLVLINLQNHYGFSYGKSKNKIIISFNK